MRFSYKKYFLLNQTDSNYCFIFLFCPLCMLLSIYPTFLYILENMLLVFERDQEVSANTKVTRSAEKDEII